MTKPHTPLCFGVDCSDLSLTHVWKQVCGSLLKIMNSSACNLGFFIVLETKGHNFCKVSCNHL